MISQPGHDSDYLRFHREHEHLSKTFGAGSFGPKAEAFALFFGTPLIPLAQTRQAERDKLTAEVHGYLLHERKDAP